MLASLTIPQVMTAVNTLNKDYNSKSEINELAKIFEADTESLKLLTKKSLLKPDFVRLPHNGDEPIYVYVGNDFSNQQKEANTTKHNPNRQTEQITKPNKPQPARQ